MFRVELAKAMRRWRTWVLAVLLGAVPGLIVLALVLVPPPPGADDGFFTLATRNGLFAPVAALTAVQPFLLPPLPLVTAEIVNVERAIRLPVGVQGTLQLDQPLAAGVNREAAQVGGYPASA